jgi:hypothetical protein
MLRFMRFRFFKFIFVVFICSALLFLGCGDTDNNQNDNVISESDGFAAGLLGKIVDGLLDGATGEIGGDAMGMILSLLGWGGSSGDEAFDRMNKELAKIEDQLAAISDQLTALLKQLEIDKEEILANTNDPTDAMNQIFTFHSELETKAKDKKPGEGDKDDLTDFANQIENNYQIENDVNSIYHAIMPLDIAKTPILNNITDLSNHRVTGADKKGTLFDAYKNLEIYTSQLLYNQLKGVNLVVEAKNVLYPPDNNASEASIYMDAYDKETLPDEVWCPDNGYSFIYNAWRLILMNVDLNKSDSKMLPEYSQEITKRAEFFRRIAMHKKDFGAKALMFSTSDEKQPEIFIIDPEEGTNWMPKSVTKYSLPGKTYDYWDGRDVKASDTYSVYLYDFGSVEPGNYSISQSYTGKLLGSFTAQKYDDDYTVSSDGEYTFGFVAVGNRIVNRFPEDSDRWSTWTKDMTKSHTKGGANDWPYELYGNTDDSYPYHGHAELDGHFTYTGQTEKNITVKYSLAASGYNEAYNNAMYGNGEAYTKISVGVWDNTDGDFPSDDCKDHQTKKHSSIGNGKKSFNDNMEGSCKFKAKPNHRYYFYANMHVWSDNLNMDPVKSEIKIDKVNYVHIIFE